METTTETRIYRILSNLSAVPVEEIGIDDRLREDLGLDSVGSMELVSMLSEEFSIDVELEEAVQITDVRGLMALAGKRLADA